MEENGRWLSPLIPLLDDGLCGDVAGHALTDGGSDEGGVADVVGGSVVVIAIAVGKG